MIVVENKIVERQNPKRRLAAESTASDDDDDQILITPRVPLGRHLTKSMDKNKEM